MPYVETITLFRSDLFDIHMTDHGRRRPIVQAIDQLLDGLLLTRDMRFDTTVRAIADPAAHAKRLRLPLRPGTEEDALHLAGHMNMATDARHAHTTEISGASSAFMPTTL